MVLKSPFNLTSVMACRGDPPPPKLQAPCIMCGLRVFFDRLLPGCHTISPERIPRETCRGTKQTRFSTVQPRFILCSRRSQDIHSHMAPASQPPTPQLSPNPPSIRSGRAASQLRPITLTPDYVATAEGSATAAPDGSLPSTACFLEPLSPGPRESPSAARSPAALMRSSASLAARCALSSTCKPSANAQ